MELNDEIMQQNIVFSKMIEYFLERGIVTQEDITGFLADFSRQSEEEIVQTKNPVLRRRQDKLDDLETRRKNMLDSLRKK